MSNFKDYKTLDVWIKSRELTNLTYSLTRSYPKEEIFGLVSQMRRCAVSIVSNIAEGIGRNYTNETIHFLEIAKGSIFELETQLIISLDQQFLKIEDFEKISLLIEDCKKLLNGFISYYRQKAKH